MDCNTLPNAYHSVFDRRSKHVFTSSLGSRVLIPISSLSGIANRLDRGLTIISNQIYGLILSLTVVLLEKTPFLIPAPVDILPAGDLPT